MAGAEARKDTETRIPPITTVVPLLSQERSPVNHARPRPTHIPSHGEEGYDAYRKHRDVALEVAVKQLEQELAHHAAWRCIMIESDRLTLHLNSQSKLSQQELVDLQKATHFDKKELQQWYKGD